MHFIWFQFIMSELCSCRKLIHEHLVVYGLLSEWWRKQLCENSWMTGRNPDNFSVEMPFSSPEYDCV